MISNRSLEVQPPSASLAITQIAREMKAKGQQVATLSMGDAHFCPPHPIQQALKLAVEEGHTHYTSVQGILQLREAIAEYYHGLYSPEDIVVTAGVKQGLFSHLSSASYERICVLEPAWLGYRSLVEMCNMQYIPLNSYKQQWLDELGDLDFDALILCSPNNPDGHCLSRQQAEIILDIAERKGATILLDEIYRHYLYDENMHHADLFHGNHRVVVFNGFSKSHAVSGLRVGFIAAKDTNVIQGVLASQSVVATCASSIAQHGLVGFADVMDEVASNVAYYQENRDLIVRSFPELMPYLPQGGLYFFIDVSIWGHQDADVFCARLLKESGVALVPGSAYGEQFSGWLRMSFSVSRQEVDFAISGLSAFVHGG